MAIPIWFRAMLIALAAYCGLIQGSLGAYIETYRYQKALVIHSVQEEIDRAASGIPEPWYFNFTSCLALDDVG